MSEMRKEIKAIIQNIIDNPQQWDLDEDRHVIRCKKLFRSNLKIYLPDKVLAFLGLEYGHIIFYEFSDQIKTEFLNRKEYLFLDKALRSYQAWVKSEKLNILDRISKQLEK